MLGCCIIINCIVPALLAVSAYAGIREKALAIPFRMQIFEERKKRSKVSKLIHKIFICQSKNKKKPKRFISYKTIEIKCPEIPTFTNDEELIDSKSLVESPLSMAIGKRNPESATTSSQHNLDGLVSALHKFKLSTALSR